MFSWGHININVSDLDRSVKFYQQLGFEVFLPSIPYLALNQETSNQVSAEAAEALGLPSGVSGRACIMQLDDGFPKVDLTELRGVESGAALTNQDLGMVRLCLISQDLQKDYEDLLDKGVVFVTPPMPCHDRLADIAICRDPDGTLIELLQVYLERWSLPS